MWNAIKEFFRKKDSTIVATFIIGNTSIIKNDIPFVRLYTCWEDDTGKRWFKSSLKGPRDWHIEVMLRCWKKRGLPFDHIPSYWDVDHGSATPYGHDYYHEVFDPYACVRT